MRAMNWKKTYMFKLLFSYFAVTIMTVALIGFLFSATILGGINNEIGKMSMDSLKQLNHTIDEYVLNLAEQISLDIAYSNPQFQYLCNEAVIKPSVTTYEFIKYLAGLKNSYAFIHSIVLYFPGKEAVYTDNGIWYKNEYPEIFNIFYNEIKDFNILKSDRLWMDARIMDGIPTGGTKTYVIPFVRSLFRAGEDDGQWYVVINVHADEIYKNMLSDRSDMFKNLFITNSQGEILFRKNESADLANLNANFFKPIVEGKSQGDSVQRINKNDYLVSFATSQSTGWKYVLAVRNESSAAVTDLIKRLVIWICLLAMLFGFIVSSILAKRLNAPLKGILKLIKGLNLERAVNIDEYGMLRDTIKDLSEKILQYKNSLTENLSAVKLMTLSNIIRGKFTDINDLHKKLMLFNIRFAHPGYVIAVAEVDNYEKLVGMLGTEELEVLKIKLSQVMEQYIQEQMPCLVAEYETNRMICLINFDGDHKSNYNNLYNVINHLAEDFERSWHVTFSMGVGSVQEDFKKMDISYEHAAAALDYKYIEGNRSFIEYGKASSKFIHTIPFPREIYDRFTSMVSRCDIERTITVLEEFEKLIKDAELTSECCRSLTHEFAVSFFNYFSDLEISKDFRVSDRLNDIKVLSGYIEWLGQVSREVIRMLEHKKISRYKELIDKIVEYIYVNIDKDICFNSIAEHVSLSPNYLSKIFKDEIGITFTDYVINTKLEFARKILEQGDIKIQDISSRLGYATPQYFIKKFKLRYGITPKQYQVDYSKEKLTLK